MRVIQEVIKMALWKSLAIEISRLIEESNDPKETLNLIEDTLRKYRRYEIFWAGSK